jgi:hypothetical protein
LFDKKIDSNKMKYWGLLPSVLIGLLWSCNGGPEKPISVAAQRAQDSVGITETVHNFYKWYNANGGQLGYDFVKVEGERVIFDEAKLMERLNRFKESGAISEYFIQNELNFYRTCARRWAVEKPGDVLPGLEIDKYYCAQDGDFEAFATDPVSLVTFHPKNAVARLTFKDPAANGPYRDFEMIKENGKWFIVMVACNTGIR